MAPVSGAIFLCNPPPAFPTSATNQPERQSTVTMRLRTGISHTKMTFQRSRMKKERFGGTALRHGDSAGADWVRTWRKRSRDFPLPALANSPLAERSGCRASGPLQLQLHIAPMDRCSGKSTSRRNGSEWAITQSEAGKDRHNHNSTGVKQMKHTAQTALGALAALYARSGSLFQRSPHGNRCGPSNSSFPPAPAAAPIRWRGRSRASSPSTI